MAKRPLGPYTAGDVLLQCGACGKQDAFEVRKATLVAGFFTDPMRKVVQVICWNCGHIHWFRR